MSCIQAKTMRAFHNRIKQCVIRHVSHQCEYLFDLAVGRGGDIFKWHKCDIPNVIGVDIDTEYINEANRRYKSSEIFSNEYKYSFHVVKHDDILHELYEHDKFNVVSCQFAIHYFFKSKERLHQMLHDVTLL